MRVVTLSFLVAGVVLLAESASAAPRCLDAPGDVADIAAARSAVDASCHCFDFATPGSFTRCVGEVAKARVLASQLRPQCLGQVRKTYARSICGKPLDRQQGPSVPCVTESASGRVACSVKPRRRCGMGAPGSPCWGSTTCLDAADTDGDLLISTADAGTCTAGADAFTDNGDGTITDASTGLEWEKKSDDGTLNDRDLCHPYYGVCSGDGTTSCTRDADCSVAGGTCDAADCQTPLPAGRTVFEWIDELNATAFAGHTDWRLPTVNELSTLMRTIPGSPRIAAPFDSGCVPGCTVTSCSCTTSASDFARYHTSSLVKPLPESWIVHFELPDLGGAPFFAGLLARAVRDTP